MYQTRKYWEPKNIWKWEPNTDLVKFIWSGSVLVPVLNSNILNCLNMRNQPYYCPYHRSWWHTWFSYLYTYTMVYSCIFHITRLHSLSPCFPNQQILVFTHVRGYICHTVTLLLRGIIVEMYLISHFNSVFGVCCHCCYCATMILWYISVNDDICFYMDFRLKSMTYESGWEISITCKEDLWAIS